MKILLAIALVMQLALMPVLSGCDDHDKEARFSSAEESIAHCINKTEDTITTEDTLDRYILTQNIKGRAIYSLVSIEKEQRHVVYLLLTISENNRYTTRPVTPKHDLNDHSGDPYTHYTLAPEDGSTYVTVGKLFDRSYNAYHNDKRINSNNSSVFYVVSSEEPQVHIHNNR